MTFESSFHCRGCELCRRLLCRSVVTLLLFQYQLTEESSVVSSSEDRSRLARIFNMSDVAVQTVKMVTALLSVLMYNSSETVLHLANNIVHQRYLFLI